MPLPTHAIALGGALVPTFDVTEITDQTELSALKDLGAVGIRGGALYSIQGEAGSLAFSPVTTGNGGGAPLTDAQVGDKAFKNPPSTLSVAQQKAVLDAIAGASLAQARQGIAEISSLNNDDDVADTLRLAERNSDAIAESYKFYISGATAGGLRGKLIRRTSTALDPSVSKADFRAKFSTYWETILTDSVEDQANLNADAIAALDAKTADLHAGEIVPAGWRDADAANGGLNRGPGGTTRPDQSYARAVTAWETEVSKRGGYIVARVLSTIAPAQARVRYISRPTSSGRILREAFLLSTWRKVGESADGTWTYYVNPRLIGTAVATLKLETTSDDEHLGTSRFSGLVDGELADGLVDEDALTQAVKTKLNSDSGTDQTARDAAASAQSAATAAQNAAIDAQTDATRALADAVAAHAAANAAQTTADTADSKGDTAIVAAANADADAVAAQATADAALPKAGGTMTGKIVLDGAPTADLHAASKKYVDDHNPLAPGLAVPQWSSLSGTIPKGRVVEHNDFFFISRVEHTKQATGPDGDPANWWDLGEWWGVLATQKYYPEGATGKTGAGDTLKIWRASEFIHDTDPVPTAAGNTKWKQIWPPTAPGNLTDAEKAEWRNAIGAPSPTSARKERISFRDTASGSTTIELTPVSVDPISVVVGEGAAQFLSGVSGNDWNVKAGSYLVEIVADVAGGGSNATIQFDLRDASNDAVLKHTSASYLHNQRHTLTKLLTIDLAADTNVNMVRDMVRGAARVRSATATFSLLRGDASSVATLEQQVEDAEDDIAEIEVDVAANAAAIRAGVANAEAFASNLVGNLVFGDAGSVTEWPEDAPPAADAAQRIFVAETLTRSYTVPAANSKDTSDATVAISHEPGLYELTTGAAINQIEIEVDKSAAVDGGSDTDYGATLRVFNWHRDRHFRHVPTVGKVLHSPLGSAVSGFVELTNGASHDSYAMLLENSLWQAWTVFGERTFFAHMNRTKQDGTAMHEAVELGGNDPVVTVHGVSYRVFSPFAPIPLAKQHFLRNAYEENQGDTAAAIAARKVTIYFNGAADDTSTRFFLGNASKGYTLVETAYGTERPVLSPTVRHLTAVNKTDYDALSTKDATTIYAVEGQGLYHGPTLLGRPSQTVLLWDHTARADAWHPSGEQLAAGVTTKIYEGIGGDKPWWRLEAEIKWTQTRNSLGYEHIGLITFPAWRQGEILSARPLRLHGEGRFGGLDNTSTLNAILNLVSRNDEITNPSHLFIEGFNPGGDTGIVATTQITVRLWGVR